MHADRNDGSWGFAHMMHRHSPASPVPSGRTQPRNHATANVGFGARRNLISISPLRRRWRRPCCVLHCGQMRALNRAATALCAARVPHVHPARFVLGGLARDGLVSVCGSAGGMPSRLASTTAAAAPPAPAAAGAGASTAPSQPPLDVELPGCVACARAALPTRSDRRGGCLPTADRCLPRPARACHSPRHTRTHRLPRTTSVAASRSCGPPATCRRRRCR